MSEITGISWAPLRSVSFFRRFRQDPAATVCATIRPPHGNPATVTSPVWVSSRANRWADTDAAPEREVFEDVERYGHAGSFGAAVAVRSGTDATGAASPVGRVWSVDRHAKSSRKVARRERS